MEDIIDIIVTETTNTIEITAQPNDEIIDVNIIDNREDIVLNVTPTVVEININSLTSNFGVAWGDITGTLADQTDLNTVLTAKANLVDGKVPSSELPSYVDDVVEVATFSALPATGEIGKIYVVLDTNKIYRWSGSTYIEIADSTAVWGAITGTLSSQTDLQTALDAKQDDLNGTGFVKASGTTITYDNSTYLTTSSAASTYVPYTGATANVNLGLNYSLTAALIIKSGGTSTQFLKADGSIDTNTYLTTGLAASTYLPLTGGTLTGDLTLSSGNPRLYFTDTDNNPDYFISNTDGTFTIYDVTNSTSRFTIGTTGNGTFGGNLTVGQIIRSGGTSSQFLKADGSVDSSTYAKRSGLTDGYLPAWSSSLLGGSLTDSFISYASNITYVAGMGLSTLNGLDIEGNYGAGTGGLKIRSYDETTGNAYIDFANTGGRMYLGLNRSTAGGLMTNATAYATVLTTGLGTANLEFGTNATKRVTIDGSTGAVTLTSALSGTSATFSGLTVENNQNGSTWIISKNTNAGAGAAAGFLMTNNTGDLGAISLLSSGNSPANGLFIRTLSTNSLILGTNSTANLTIASGGAATFSSSVTATTFTAGSSSTSSDVLINLSADTGAFAIKNVRASHSFSIFDHQAGVDRVFINSSGNVGIGTTAPTNVAASWTTLEVSARASGGGGILYLTNFGSTVKSQIYSDDNGGKLGTTTNHPLVFETNSTERMRITSGGNVLIGRTSAIGFALEVGGSTWSEKYRLNDTGGGYVTWEMENSSRWRMNYLGRFSGYGAGTLTTDASGNISASSDRSLKDVIKPIENVLENIKDFEPVYFKWNDKTDLDKENVYMSTIAQSIQKHYPDAVGKMADGTLTVQDRAVTAILVQAIKELTEKVKTLENK